MLFRSIAFWTDALPVVMEARDPELVRNVFNDLPISYSMRAGQTDLGQAVNEAVKLVKDFPEGSTRLIIVTDGDSVRVKQAVLVAGKRKWKTVKSIQK